MAGYLKLHAIHISRKKMIECGVDGLSREMTNEGFIQGTPMLNFLPMHKSTVERSEGLLSWIAFWWLKDERLNHLSPEG